MRPASRCAAPGPGARPGELRTLDLPKVAQVQCPVMHILLVEDDLDLGPALLAALKAEGMTAQWVRRAADARGARGPEVDLVLLDRPWPVRKGWTCCATGDRSASRHR